MTNIRRDRELIQDITRIENEFDPATFSPEEEAIQLFNQELMQQAMEDDQASEAPPEPEALDGEEGQLDAAEQNNFEELFEDIINNSITHYNYSFGPKSEAEFSFFLNAIRSNDSVESINFAFSRLEDHMIEQLCDTLRAKHNITELIFEHCDLSDENLKTIASSALSMGNLSYLNLKNNQISAEGAKEISHFIKNHNLIASINLSNNPLGNEGIKKIMNAMKYNTGIEEISLSNCDFDPEVVSKIAKIIRTHENLASIILDKNEITNDGAILIANSLMQRSEDLPAIENISIRDCSIGNDGLIAMAEAAIEYEELRFLLVKDNDLTSEGYRKFADLVKENTKLITLDLFDYDRVLNEEEAEWFIEALDSNPNIQHLKLNIENSQQRKIIQDSLKINNDVNALLHDCFRDFMEFVDIHYIIDEDLFHFVYNNINKIHPELILDEHDLSYWEEFESTIRSIYQGTENEDSDYEYFQDEDEEVEYQDEDDGGNNDAQNQNPNPDLDEAPKTPEPRTNNENGLGENLSVNSATHSVLWDHHQNTPSQLPMEDDQDFEDIDSIGDADSDGGESLQTLQDLLDLMREQQMNNGFIIDNTNILMGDNTFEFDNTRDTDSDF